MDDFVRQVLARLDRNAADAYDKAERLLDSEWRSIWKAQAGTYQSAARIVREMWEEEQARIAAEESGEAAIKDSLPDQYRPHQLVRQIRGNE